MASHIVSDIFGYRYLMIVDPNDDPAMHQAIIFNDEHFATQFVRWLKMEEHSCLAVLKDAGMIDHQIGQTWHELVEALVAGQIRMFKLPDDGA